MRNLARCMWVGAVSLFVSGCGGGGGGSANVTGVIGSVTMQPQSAVYAYDSRYANVFIRITESSDPCGDWKSGRQRPNDVVLDLSVADFATADVPAGTYTYNVVGDQIVTGGEFTQVGDQCDRGVHEQIVHGTITLENTVGPAHENLQGSFDMDLGDPASQYDGGHLSGGFTAVYCDADLAKVPAPTCSP